MGKLGFVLDEILHKTPVPTRCTFVQNSRSLGHTFGGTSWRQGLEPLLFTLLLVVQKLVNFHGFKPVHP